MQTIREAVLETANIVSLTIDTPEPFPQWIPGQFLRLCLRKGDSWTEEHTFTVSSAPGDPVRISVKAVGRFTTPLLTIQPGTEVRIRGPYGMFCKGIEQQPEIVMIAGGIGITPFWSVLEHFSRIGCKSTITLFWANNTVADIVRPDEFSALTKKLNLRIIHAIWRDEQTLATLPAQPNVTFLPGLLTSDIFSAHARFDKATIYVCGPPVMNEKITATLKDMNVDASRIFTEAQIAPKVQGS